MVQVPVVHQFSADLEIRGPRTRRVHQQQSPRKQQHNPLALPAPPSVNPHIASELLYGCVPGSLGQSSSVSVPMAAAAATVPSDSFRKARPRSFFEQLQLSPRKPQPRRLPTLLGASKGQGSMRNRLDIGGSVEQLGSDAAVTQDERAELPVEMPLELLSDVRWILFPTTIANQPRDLEMSMSQRTPSTLEHDLLLQMLRRLRMLRPFSDADLEPVARVCQLRFYPRYSAIVRADTQGKTCLVLMSGVAAALSSTKPGGGGARGGGGGGGGLGGKHDAHDPLVPTILGKGAVIDEPALVTECWREASVSAVTDATVVTLSRDSLMSACRPSVRDALLASAEFAEVKHEVVRQLLLHRPFFKDRTEQQLNGLAAIMEVRHVESGTTIFAQGDYGKTFYVLIDGEVVISKTPEKYAFGGAGAAAAAAAADGETSSNEASKMLREYFQWSDRPWFGELALWLNKPRAGSAVVRERARLLVLEAHHFDTFLGLVPEFRPYLNRRNMYMKDNQDNNGKRRSVVAEGSESSVANAAFRLASGGKLGGFAKAGPKALAQRAVFAERWERLVYNLLYKMVRPDPKVVVSKVSFKVEDYQ